MFRGSRVLLELPRESGPELRSGLNLYGCTGRPDPLGTSVFLTLHEQTFRVEQGADMDVRKEKGNYRVNTMHIRKMNFLRSLF